MELTIATQKIGNIKIEIDNYAIETVLIRNNMIKIARVLQIKQEDEELSED